MLPLVRGGTFPASQQVAGMGLELGFLFADCGTVNAAMKGRAVFCTS